MDPATENQTLPLENVATASDAGAEETVPDDKPPTQDLDDAQQTGYPHPLVQKIADYFELAERKTSFRTELLARLVTFMTMAYILAVNASIISDSGGPCNTDLGDSADFDSCLETVC